METTLLLSNYECVYTVFHKTRTYHLQMNNRLLVGFLLALTFPVGCAVAHADDSNREQRIVESPQ